MLLALAAVLGAARLVVDTTGVAVTGDAADPDRGSTRAPAGASDPASQRHDPGPALGDLLANLRARMSRPPPRPTSAQARAAAGVRTLFNDFDLDAASELYERPSVGMEEWVEWLRLRLGRCEEGEVMAVRDDSVRYIYPCEGGRLEAEIKLGHDTGKIAALVMGARDIPLADPVREAADAVMQLHAAWDPALFARTFSEKFVAEDIRRLLLDLRAQYGDCRLAEPDLVSVRGALIALQCERGSRLMKLELRQQDDRIRTLWIRDPRPR